MKHTYHDRARAYHMRRNRKSWVSIAQACGYSGPSAARVSAMNYGHHHGLPELPTYTITKGEMAYEDREAGDTWAAIAYRLEMYTPSSCRDSARHYAKRNDLPWPPQQQQQETK